MSKIEGYNCTFQMIPISHLHPHETVQRLLRQDHAENIKANFNANALRPLLVVPSSGKVGVYKVWDGQHRLWALKSLFAATKTVQCQVYHGLSDQKLAELQELLNKTTKQWTQLERFSNLVTAKDPITLEIKGCVESFGLYVGSMSTHDGVKAVAALRTIVDTGGLGLLNRVLSLLTDTWSKDWDAYQSAILTGASMFLEKHQDIATASVSSRLKKDGTAASFLGEARGYSKATKISVASSVAVLMVRAYNTRRKLDRLPDFHK